METNSWSRHLLVLALKGLLKFLSVLIRRQSASPLPSGTGGMPG